MPDERHAWESAAADWVERVRSNPQLKLADVAIRSLLPAANGLAVDVGCGEGRLSRELRELGWDAMGIDRSPALVEAARSADPEGRYRVAAIDALPVDDGAAALVCCVNVLMHVEDLDAAVSELVRVCAPGGAIVLGTLHPTAAAGQYDEEADELRVRDYFAANVEPVPLGEHHVFHTHRTIEQYLAPFFARGCIVDGLREVPGRTGSIPRYLALRLARR